MLSGLGLLLVMTTGGVAFCCFWVLLLGTVFWMLRGGGFGELCVLLWIAWWVCVLSFWGCGFRWLICGCLWVLVLWFDVVSWMFWMVFVCDGLVGCCWRCGGRSTLGLLFGF